MSYKFSVVIIAHNAERTIEDCLAKMVQLSDNVILVLDNKSNDSTEEIAKRYPVTLLKLDWQGYSATKNYGAEQAQYPWILSIDSDEVPDANLSQQLKHLVLQDNTVYQCMRRTWIADYPVKYCGWYPDSVLRLYNKYNVQWDQNLVHERLILPPQTKIETLKGLLEHYSFVDETHMKKKFEQYAYLRSQEWKTSGKSPSIVKQLLGPTFRFLKTYIIKRGVLDGKYGWLIAKNEFLMKRKELYYWKNSQGVSNQ